MQLKTLENYGRASATQIFLVLTSCAAQIEKTRILEQILSSITELSYF